MAALRKGLGGASAESLSWQHDFVRGLIRFVVGDAHIVAELRPTPPAFGSLFMYRGLTLYVPGSDPGRSVTHRSQILPPACEPISALLTHLQAEGDHACNLGAPRGRTAGGPIDGGTPTRALYRRFSNRDHRVEVTDNLQTIRGRMAQLTADAVVASPRPRPRQPAARDGPANRSRRRFPAQRDRSRRGHRRRLGARADGQVVQQHTVRGYVGQPRSPAHAARHARRGRRRRVDRRGDPGAQDRLSRRAPVSRLQRWRSESRAVHRQTGSCSSGMPAARG